MAQRILVVDDSENFGHDQKHTKPISLKMAPGIIWKAFQLTAAIAHDLRTPTSIILGYSEALANVKLAPDSDTFRVVHQEANHLAYLIEDLRTLSLADAGELQLQRSPLDSAWQLPALLSLRMEVIFGWGMWPDQGLGSHYSCQSGRVTNRRYSSSVCIGSG